MPLRFSVYFAFRAFDVSQQVALEPVCHHDPRNWDSILDLPGPGGSKTEETSHTALNMALCAG